MGQSDERSPLVSMLFRTFLKADRQRGKVQIVCAAMRRCSVNLYNTEEVRE